MIYSNKRLNTASKMWKRNAHVNDIADAISSTPNEIYAVCQKHRNLFPKRRQVGSVQATNKTTRSTIYHTRKCRYYIGRENRECGKSIIKGQYCKSCMPKTLPNAGFYARAL